MALTEQPSSIRASTGSLVQRCVVAIQRLYAGFYEGGFAESATVALDSLFTGVAKPLGLAVLTFDAVHVISPLALGGETSQNRGSRSEAWLTPRFGLAPQPVSAGSGALSVTGYELWWANGYIHHGAASSEDNLNCDRHCSFLSQPLQRLIYVGAVRISRQSQSFSSLGGGADFAVFRSVFLALPRLSAVLGGFGYIALFNQAIQYRIDCGERVFLFRDIPAEFLQFVPDSPPVNGKREAFITWRMSSVRLCCVIASSVGSSRGRANPSCRQLPAAGLQVRS